MTTETWSVQVDIGLHKAVSADDVDELTDRLSALGAAVAVDEAGHLTLHLSVTASTIAGAFRAGQKRVTEAITGVVIGDLIGMQVLTMAEFRRRLEIDPLDGVWGVTETAEFLGVTPQRLSQLIRDNPAQLPFKKLAGDTGARLFLDATVRRFASNHRRANGRPRINPTTTPKTASAYRQWLIIWTDMEQHPDDPNLTVAERHGVKVSRIVSIRRAGRDGLLTPQGLAERERRAQAADEEPQ